MSKRCKFRKFINGLSEEDVRKGLEDAYLMMDRCQQVLRGKDVEPTEMNDDGLGEELFYLCKKIGKEKGILEDLLRDCSDFASTLLDVYAPIEPVGTPVKKPKPKYKVGDEVWYVLDGLIHTSEVTGRVNSLQPKWAYTTEDCDGVMEDELFPTMDKLIEHLKSHINKN